ncbi:hypothetical protein QFZ25_003082 [Bacillus atrophaeus]|nr:hypothetical protein [Bacillus atrophaeus]MDQ0929022.1 hypothetical protein [Bacillus atrophaeus]
MTIIQRTITILIGAQLIASAVILIIFDLNAYDHFLGDFSWVRYIKELNGTIPFFLLMGGLFFLLLGFCFPARKRKRISVHGKENSLK